VSLAFLRNTIFPLLSTKHVVLRKTIAQEKNHNINTPYRHNQSNQTIERCLFNKFDLLGRYDKKDMVRDHDLWDMKEFQNSSCEIDHMGVG
jgi:hypothetical protein